MPQGAPSPPKMEVKKLHETASLPFRAYEDSIGLDVSAHLLTETGRPNNAIVSPNMTRAIGTGLICIAPPGFFISVCSRSGMAQKSVFVANSPGIIDPDYRGEVIILLYNGGHLPFYIKHEDRIAQLVLLPRPPFVNLSEVKSFMPTARGDQGFGSTG